MYIYIYIYILNKIFYFIYKTFDSHYLANLHRKQIKHPTTMKIYI